VLKFETNFGQVETHWLDRWGHVKRAAFFYPLSCDVSDVLANNHALVQLFSPQQLKFSKIARVLQ
jgi:hypothetical protein